MVWPSEPQKRESGILDHQVLVIIRRPGTVTLPAFNVFCLGKNIRSEPLIPQPFEPLSCFLVIRFCTLLPHFLFFGDLDQSFLSAISYIPATADEELRTCFKQVDNLLPVMIETILHILATF